MTLQSKPNTDDLRIKEIKELVPPSHIFREFPVGVQAAQTTFDGRQAIHRILHGADDRLLVVIGPCSIHDVEMALDYAKRLQKELPRFEGSADRDAGLFREAADYRGLEGVDQRSASGQQFPYQ